MQMSQAAITDMVKKSVAARITLFATGVADRYLFATATERAIEATFAEEAVLPPSHLEAMHYVD